MLSRLASLPTDEDTRNHALSAYQILETVRREAGRLINDPDLEALGLQQNHVRLYRRWAEDLDLVEILLPFIERYNNADKRLTRLTATFAQQVGWPSPITPLVTTFSSQYFWTLVGFNLVCVPTGEAFSLLSLPDLCHELGHILLFENEPLFLDGFAYELTSYIRVEKQRVDWSQRPPDYIQLYDLLFAQWYDAWVREFVSDMVATYLVGPAFGWQHVRLATSSGRSPFKPALGAVAEHPADDSRLRGVV